jgi:hypothetical protein
MNELQQFVSDRYTGTVIVGSVGSYLATATVTLGSGLTYASPIVLNPGGYAQWISVIPTRALSQWQIQGIKRLQEILSLPKDWDSYGSSPPTQEAVNTAMKLMTGIDIDYFVAPHVVPVSGGGLQLEWEAGTRELELEVLNDGSVEYLKSERGDPIEEECIHDLDEVRSLYIWLISPASTKMAA